MTRFSSLWAFVIAFLAVPVANGQQPAAAEAETAVKIEALGGRVYRNAAGQVDIVDLQGKVFGDEHLGLLQAFPALRNLSLDGSRVTDAGLEQLLNVPLLEEVSLRRTSVTAAAAKSFNDRHPQVFHVALSPRGSPAMLAIVPVAFVMAAVGIWLFRMTRRKRDILAPRTYVQGLGYGLLLVIVAIVITIVGILNFLGFDFHLSDLAG
jgi:hypothetical protein